MRSFQPDSFSSQTIQVLSNQSRKLLEVWISTISGGRFLSFPFFEELTMNETMAQRRMKMLEAFTLRCVLQVL
jgi:hypothetical protein